MKFLYVILAISLLIGSGCSRQESEPGKVNAATQAPAEPPIVKTAVATQKIVERAISVTGTLLPDETVTVSAEVAGRISNIRSDFGQAVRRGDVLIELDRTEFDLQVERAQGALNQALARLGLPAYNGKVAPPQTTAGVRQAMAQLEDAKYKYESAAKLAKSGDIAQDRVNETEKAYRARQAALEAAQDELRTQWMSVTSLEADLKLAQKRRGDTVIRAPFDGVVGEKLISAGQSVKDNVGILRLVKVYPMRLRLEVPEPAANAVRPGTTLSFHTDAAPGVTFRAAVRELNPTLDTRNRTLTAEARMNSADSRLRPGMFVQIRMITEPAAPIITVPKQALYNIAGISKLFKIDGGVARQINVVPGEEVEGGVEIPGGVLNPGDRVAVSDLGVLTTGMKVRQ